MVALADGGMAQVVGAILKQFFPAEGTHLHLTGLSLTDAAGRTIRLHARLATIVQDGAAHRDIWKCKGDAGTRMCMCCLAVSAGSEISDIDPSLKSNAITEGELVFTTDAAVKDAARRLASWKGRESKAAFERRQ